MTKAHKFVNYTCTNYSISPICFHPLSFFRGMHYQHIHTHVPIKCFFEGVGHYS